MRVATIDIGTNTVLLLVAERGPDGALHAVAERATITRLGEGVDRTRTLAPAAIERTRAALEEYAAVVREIGADRMAVVGTSAMRDAVGGDELRRDIRELFGVDVRVLRGAEEARLTFVGALSGLSRTGTPAPSMVFDIGGGSTEVVVGRPALHGPEIQLAESYDIGSVRLTERHVSHDPPTREEVALVRRSAGSALAGAPRPALADAPVGVAGTMTTLASVALALPRYDGALVHGFEMTRAALDEVVTRLASIDLATRRRLPGMEPKRADVIIAGGVIALAVLEWAGAERVCISDRGVRWGLAEELSA